MSKGDTFENELLAHIFHNAAIAGIGDATGLPAAATVGSLYLALHSADPGEAGTQATNEVTYAGYARQAVARTTGGFTLAANQISLAAAVNFPESAGGGSAASHFSVGVAVSGATKLLYKGALNQSIPCQNAGVTPQLGTGTVITED